MSVSTLAIDQPATARFATTEMSTNATSQTTKKGQLAELPPNMVKKMAAFKIW